MYEDPISNSIGREYQPNNEGFPIDKRWNSLGELTIKEMSGVGAINKQINNTPPTLETRVIQDEVLVKVVTIWVEKYGVDKGALREANRVMKEKEGEEMLNLVQNTSQIDGEESEMELDSKEEDSGDVEEGELMEERMLE